MTEEAFKPAEMVCLGACKLTGGKLGTLYHFVEPGDVLGEAFPVARSKGKDGVPGGVYLIPTDAERSKAQFVNRQWSRMWPDAEAVAQWRAKSDALEVSHRHAKRTAGKEREALEAALACLEPIRKLYMGTDRLGKLALEVAVLDYLRTWRP